jgi:hypothetical protein
MLTRLFRQRRRIVVLVLGAMLCGALAFGIGVAPLICGGLGLAVACTLIMLAPNRRSWIEALGIGLVLAALMNLPASSFPLAIVASAALAHLAIHGRWSDRTTLRLGLISHRVARVTATPAHVWAALIPGEGHPDDHWSGTLLDFDHDPDDPFTTYLRYRAPDGLHEEMTITFLDHDGPRHCRYVIERFDEGFAEAGIMEITITEPEPGKCQIDSNLAFDALPARIALGRWLDDTFGDEWDSFAATVSARHDWSIHGLRRPKQAEA